MAKFREVFAGVFVAVLANFILQTLIDGGYFYPKVLNHAPGPCRVYNVDGAEDVQILDNGLALFSSGTKYFTSLRSDPRVLARKGRIYLFDMNNPNKDPEELNLKSFNTTGFNPHGISLYKDSRTGMVSVFVVNHRPDAQAIEIFDFDEKLKTLEFRRSVVDEKIHSPNDVVAVGPESFYLTNDNFFPFDQVFLRLVSVVFLSRFLKSGVVFFDGKTSWDVAGGMVVPNGISLSKDGRYVFVSAGMQPNINVYRKDDAGFLTHVQTIEMGTKVDNINIDHKTGELWIAAIPKPMDFVFFNENIDHPVVSQVVNLKLGKENLHASVPFPAFELREVYLNNGSELRAATGAHVYNNKLAVAAIFDKFMICELNFY